jgi:hypothetical protein
MKYPLPVCALTLMATALAGCALPPSTIPNELKMVSAGHTGCMPDDNQLSNISANLDGNGTWNATCAGKTYLCSGLASTRGSESYSCAPAVQ